MTTTRRFKLIGTLLALLLYRLLVVSLVISLGTYAYNIKEANLPLASVYRTTWSLTVVSIILLLVELGVIGGYYTYISKKVLS
jgi:urea transporter